MELKRAFAALSAVVVLGLGLMLSGCGTASTANGNSSSSGSSSQDAAKNQFLAERGGNATPGAAGSGTPVAGGRAPGVFGSVQKVEGDKITIKSMIDGTESVVQLAAGATIHKQDTAQASDIKVGDTVNAVGTKEGDTVNASTVQIGTGGLGGGFGAGRGGFGGPPGAFGTPGTRPNGAFPDGTPPAGFSGQGRFRGNGTPGTGNPNASGTPGVQRDFVSGTVEKIEGDVITVKSADGSSAIFKISTNTSLQKQVEVQLSDIQQGNNITAMGQQNGSVFEATSIQLVENLAGRTPTP